MSAAPMLTAVIKESPYLARMLFELLYMYLTLGSRVRKAREAFEKQFLLAGKSKSDAKRLSTRFEDLNSSVAGVLKDGILRRQ